MFEQASASGAGRVGVDIGGTFTDVVAVDSSGRLHIGKRLTTHGAEHEGVIQAIGDTGVDTSHRETIIAHGTTLVINALLERKGARVALVTTEGFGDVIDLARANRVEPLELRYHREPVLVPSELRFEIPERTHADGNIAIKPSDVSLEQLAAALREKNVEAIAVGFINSYLNPENENLVAESLERLLPGIPVTTSTMLSRQWREYERFTTATANAYIAPVADRYLRRLVEGIGLGGFEGSFVVLDSSGGAMTSPVARQQPLRAVESGPVGGVIAARDLAGRLDIKNLVTLDIGGTTAKSALVEEGRYATTDLYWVGHGKRGLPLQVSTVDIIETPLGGGSIASLAPTGGLKVGPRSAGSRPGPVCYGLGGTQVTLTDANFYCGRIDGRNFAGSFDLDLDKAKEAMGSLAAELAMSPDRLALGIIQLANLQIASTVRRQTIERGNDPRSYTLLASGGGGGLHACEVAKIIGITQVLIPRFPGHYSAFGMLSANLRRDRRQILRLKLDQFDPSQLQDLVEDAAKELSGELDLEEGRNTGDILTTYSLAVRFAGQEHALWIPAAVAGTTVPADTASYLREAFDNEYRRRFGHLDELSQRELVELEVVVERILPTFEINYEQPAGIASETLETLWTDGHRVPTPLISRGSLEPGDSIEGPAVIHEIGSTTILPPDCVATVLDNGAMLIRV